MDIMSRQKAISDDPAPVFDYGANRSVREDGHSNENFPSLQFSQRLCGLYLVLTSIVEQCQCICWSRYRHLNEYRVLRLGEAMVPAAGIEPAT